MKFTKVEDLKEFLSWCKKQKIQQVSLGDMVVTFSNLALMEEEVAADNAGLYNENHVSSLYEQALQDLAKETTQND